MIITEEKSFTGGESFCKSLNGDILKRANFHDVTAFLDENSRVWKDNCSGIVWTDRGKAEQDKGSPIYSFEFYNATAKTFDTKTIYEYHCFICILEQKRSHFSLKASNDALELDKSYTLKNDDTGGVVFVGNDGKHLIKGRPLKFYVRKDSNWQINGHATPNTFSGMFNITKNNESGMDPKEQLQIKLSNVNFLALLLV